MTTQEARQLIGIQFRTRDERTGTEYPVTIADVKTPYGNTVVRVSDDGPWFKPNPAEQFQITNELHEKNRQPAA